MKLVDASMPSKDDLEAEDSQDPNVELAEATDSKKKPRTRKTHAEPAEQAEQVGQDHDEEDEAQRLQFDGKISKRSRTCRTFGKRMSRRNNQKKVKTSRTCCVYIALRKMFGRGQMRRN